MRSSICPLASEETKSEAEGEFEGDLERQTCRELSMKKKDCGRSSYRSVYFTTVGCSEVVCVLGLTISGIHILVVAQRTWPCHLGPCKHAHYS